MPHLPQNCAVGKDGRVTDEWHDLLLAATRWSALSLAWALLVGVTALVAGLAASSVALVGFGANSILDGSASPAPLVVEHKPCKVRLSSAL